MSYEGYVQIMCADGHYWTEDDPQEHPQCAECGKPSVWTNGVDETNCESYGEIDVSAFLVEKAALTECNLGHLHQTKSAVYRIPTIEETMKARSYRPGYGGTPLVPIEP